MDAEKSDPASNLNIPEGYTVEPLEEGRLAVYDASTGVWLGDFSPVLSHAQELAEDLIKAHEEDQERKDLLSDLAVDLPAPPDPAGIAGNDEQKVSEIHEEELLQVTGETAKADALRIRELEIVAGLAVEALSEAGDEATAEVVRQVLDSGVERPYSS